MALVVVGIVAPTVGANAAGGANVLGLSITPVDYTTGVAQTTASNGQHGNGVGYKIGYSCTGAVDCTNTTIVLPATQTDPNGFGQRILEYSTWTAPFTGAAISSTATGLTISLGTVAAGTSSTFQVVYGIRAVSSSGQTTNPPGFFPSGFQIQNQATIDSSTAVAAVTANAPAVTWSSTVPNPGILVTAGGSITAGGNVGYAIYMSDGTWISGGSGRIVQSSAYQGAGSYTVVDQLPAEAVYVTNTGGGVYDSATNTVTWTLGSSSAPSVSASGGWGKAGPGGWSNRGNFFARTVTVNYPAAKFSAADAGGCNFESTVVNQVSTTLTYLDSAKTVRSAGSSSNTTVSCFSPFARSTITKDSTADLISPNLRLINVPPDVTGQTCPAVHQDQWGRACTTTGAPLAPFANNEKWWTVSAYNGGNTAGVAVIQDNALDQADAPVNKITTTATTPAASIAWTEQCGTAAPTTGTSAGTATISAADQALGCRYTAATVTSGSVAAGNIRPTDTASGAVFQASFTYSVTSTAPIGETRTNTATATMSYPTAPQLGTISSGTATSTINFRAQPLIPFVPPNTPKPAFAASILSALVSGGGQAVPGRDVTFTLRGASGNIPVGGQITPEYVFIAPAGWKIDPGSASFPAGSVPSDVTFTYRTATVSGASVQVVIASWPNTEHFGENVPWPTMTVVAQPTFAVAAGTTSTATVAVTDSREQYDNTQATYGGPVQDTADIDNNGSTTGWFATTSVNVGVSGTDGLSVTKEICQPDATQSDGCNWVSDSNTLIAVSPIATNIKYRVTLQNTGNRTITGALGYDVLPYVGDTGVSTGTGGTPRGSTFSETVNAIQSQSGNMSLAFSASTNPQRTEVDPGATGTVNDWGTGASGKQAIRATVVGDLAPGDTASFIYTANVGSNPAIDAKACNSVAIVSDQTLVAEPSPVCATTAEADLSVTVPSRLPLQSGRPGTLPFTVTNGGGSANADAKVVLQIPTGLTVTDLTPDGWSCTSQSLLPGVTTVTCEPVNSDGSPRTLASGVPDTLNLPVTTTATSGPLTVPATVSGTDYDPELSNNDTSGVFTVEPPTTGISLTKNDGLTAVGPGTDFTYTLTAQNLLVGESLAGVTITDALPGGLIFVSATGGGTLSGVSTGQPGGTVSWTLPTLAQAGVANAGGTGATGGAGSSASVTVTVRLASGMATDVTNVATVAAPDPANIPAIFTGTASDTDQVRAVSITKSSDVPSIGVAVGSVVTYTVTETNIGTAAYTVANQATVSDDLSGLSSEASFVPGSAKVKVDGGAAASVADPTGGGVLAWSGALPVGSTAVLTYSVTVTSGATPLVNTAYSATPSSCAAGLDTNGLPCASTSDVFAPALSIVKTATLNDGNGNNTADAGETISYSFVVSNDGGSDAANVAVVDPNVTGLTPASAAITAGSSATFTSDDYTVTQADVNAGGVVSNTAHATGTDVGGDSLPDSGPSTATVPVTASAPGLTVVKTATLNDANHNGAADAGETISYSFLVTNTGNVAETGVTVVDPKVTGISPAPVALAPNATQTFTAANYTVKQSDVDAGVDITNTAHATGTAPGGQVSTSPDSTATTPVTAAAPALTIVKTATLHDTNGNGTADAGETISYQFVATNTGNVTMSGVAITDPKVTGISPASATLAPAGVQSFSAGSYTVTQADVDAGVAISNTATASGNDPAGDPATSDPSTATTAVTAAAPKLSIVKSGTLGDTNSNGKTDVGETITYSFVVTNTGNVTLHGVTVTDSKVTNITPASVTLAPGEQQVFTADPYVGLQADIDSGGQVSNTATASGTDPAGDPAVSDPSTISTPLADPAPSLSIVKTGTLDDTNHNGKTDVGETIAYSFLVTNTGNVTIHGVTVNDTKVTGIAPATVTLAPGQQQVFTADPYVGLQADINAGGKVSNTATASGLDSADAPVQSGPSTVMTPLADPAPALSIVKTATLHDLNGNNTADAGETISYSFVVTNTGNVSETNVTVVDPKVTGISPAPVALAPNETATFTAADYTVTQADVNSGADITNTAKATGKDPGNVTTTSPNSTATTPVTAAAAGLTIVKTATLNDTDHSGTADAGETISYSFVVTNTGNVTETGVTVVDPKVTGISPASVTLAPNGSQTFTAADYTVTQADVDAGVDVTNTAKATGKDPGNVTTTSPNSTATTPVTAAAAGLTIAKTATLNDTNHNGTADVGETISYSFVVTNTGNVTETGVAVNDPKVTGLIPASVTLAPNGVRSFTADVHTVTQSDVDAGVDITNTATASGTDPASDPITSAPSTANVPVTAADPSLSIVKTGTLDDQNHNGKTDVGETITYQFLVTNTGNVTIHDVTVNDSKVTGIAPASVTLAPNQQQVFTANPYIGIQADIDSGGKVSNTATASGIDPAGNQLPPSDPSTISTPLADPAPQLSIVTTAVLHDTNGNGVADAGEKITYSFEVTNIGNVTVSNVTVDDQKLTGIGPAPLTLIPGQVTTFTADDYTVTTGDVVARSIVTTATAIGDDAPRATSVVSDPSSATIMAGPLPVDSAILAFTGANPVLGELIGLFLLLAGAAFALFGRRGRRSIR